MKESLPSSSLQPLSCPSVTAPSPHPSQHRASGNSSHSAAHPTVLLITEGEADTVQAAPRQSSQHQAASTDSHRSTHPEARISQQPHVTPPGCTADSRRRPLSRHCTGQPGGAERRDVSRQSPAQRRGRGQHRAATRTQPREAGAAPGVLLPRETSGARTDCCGEENALRWTRAATEDRRAAAASGARTPAAQPRPGPTHTVPHGPTRLPPSPLPAARRPSPDSSSFLSNFFSMAPPAAQRGPSVNRAEPVPSRCRRPPLPASLSLPPPHRAGAGRPAVT